MNKTIVVSFLVLAGIVIFGSLLFLWPFIFRPPLFYNIVIAKNVEIGTEWIEINPEGGMRAERDKNYIGIVLEPPFKTPYGSHGVQTPDGKIVNPEILLVDDNGIEYDLVYSGAGGEETARYTSKSDLPHGKTFIKIRLRSDVPIKAKEILWSELDSKDLK